MPYPGQDAGQADLIRDMVTIDHVALDDEPLLLAIYYASESVPHEECLFEVARNFGFGEPSEDKHIFQVQFGPSPTFPLPAGDGLRLSLTNPTEFRQAVREGWPEVIDLQAAVADGQFERLYMRPNDQEASDLWALLERQMVAA